MAAADHILKQVKALFYMQHSIFLPGNDFGLGRIWFSITAHMDHTIKK
jgi:hypothetical protein